MEEKRTHRRYDKSFKVDAVRMVVKGKHPISEFVRDLGIDRSMLRHWVKELSKSGDGAFPGHGKLSPQDEEIRRLKRELAQVTEERDILPRELYCFTVKKAMGVFSRRP